jgi:hypothetical protein
MKKINLALAVLLLLPFMLFCQKPIFHIDFDWEMEKRFGLDQNKNGLIDLPNTPEYVNPKDGFKVICTPKILKFEGIENDNPTLYAEYTWKSETWIKGQTSKTSASYLIPFYKIGKKEGTMTFPQGKHKIVLQADIKDKNNKVHYSNTVEKTITVKDYLIIGMGDSFSSGEGNPEIPMYNQPFKKLGGVNGYVASDFSAPIWADDGSKSLDDLFLFNFGLTLTGLQGDLPYYEWLSYFLGYRENFQHQLAHRSTLCWSAQAALEIENRDPKTSVTYVNVACTGAKLEKIVYLSRHKIKGSTVPSQILELSRIVGLNRRIDAILMSIGGNDVTFSDIVESLIRENYRFAENGEKAAKLREGFDKNFPKLPTSYDQLNDLLRNGWLVGEEKRINWGKGVQRQPTLIGDLDNDGRSDLIFPFHDEKEGLIVRLLLSRTAPDGSVSFQKGEQIIGWKSEVLKNPMVGDLNNDGRSDLIFPFHDKDKGFIVNTLLSKSTSGGGVSFQRRRQVIGWGPRVLKNPMVGDLNNDGCSDLVFPFKYGGEGLIIRILLSNVEPQRVVGFFPPRLLPESVSFRPVEKTIGWKSDVLKSPMVGDLNNDGRSDLIFPFHDEKKGLIVNTLLSKAAPEGSVSFQRGGQIIAWGAGVLKSPFVGDLNNDGCSDLVFPYHSKKNGLIVRTLRSKIEPERVIPFSLRLLPESVSFQLGNRLLDGAPEC